MQLGPVKIETDQAESGNLIKLSVKSILYSEDGSSAVIDNRIVHEGERVRGAKVMKINKDTVEFEMNGKTWTQEVKG
jgi:type II secretory pathway component PulC